MCLDLPLSSRLDRLSRGAAHAAERRVSACFRPSTDLAARLVMGMIRGHDHHPQGSGVSRAWRSGGDRSPRISRITADHGLPVLLSASVYKVRQIVLARPRGRPGGVVAPGRAWRCCEVVLVSCVLRPARSATGTSASLVVESSASIHLPGIVWHLWWDGSWFLPQSAASSSVAVCPASVVRRRKSASSSSWSSL